jgi:hypothetical protein
MRWGSKQDLGHEATTWTLDIFLKGEGEEEENKEERSGRGGQRTED